MRRQRNPHLAHNRNFIHLSKHARVQFQNLYGEYLSQTLANNVFINGKQLYKAVTVNARVEYVKEYEGKTYRFLYDSGKNSIVCFLPLSDGEIDWGPPVGAEVW
jgi:hypothetical protein